MPLLPARRCLFKLQTAFPRWPAVCCNASCPECGMLIDLTHSALDRTLSMSWLK